MLTRLGFLSLRRSATKFAALTVPRRWFIKEQVEGNETAISSLPSKTGESKVAFWEEALAKKETALVLQDREQVEQYVLSLIKGYFRTTQKSFISLESNLDEHGLDSLDRVELVIQVEDDLGYIIDAENLNRFNKPKHFVNYIVQLEAYKREFHRLPLDDTKVDWSAETNVPFYSEVKAGIKKLFKKK